MIFRNKVTLKLAVTLVMLVSLLILSVGQQDSAQANTPTPEKIDSEKLQDAFEKAAEEFHIPLSILMSVGYNESRWQQHDGQPSTSGGYGIMHLTQTDEAKTYDAKGTDDGDKQSTPEETAEGDTLEKAAELLDVNPEDLKHDAAENIHGGAALLAQYAEETSGELPEDAADWYGAVAKYSNSDNDVLAKDFADQVYATIVEGVEQTVRGQHVILHAENVEPNRDSASSLDLQKEKHIMDDIDCPDSLDCEYIPAAYEQFSDSIRDYGNYDLANRPEDDLDIRYIVIHDTEGSFDSAVDWFQDQSYASANYVIRSSDGKTVEMVKPEDAAWQAGNWYFNAHSLGIEHEGYAAEGATWYSEQMYRSSAKLVSYLSERYDVPLDREHIFGHDNVPGLSPAAQTEMHWDPGPYWDWAHYFDLLGAEDEEIRPDKDDSWGENGVVTIQPDFETNQPPVTYQGKELEKQPANFVYLRTEPNDDAPLFSDPAIHPDGEEGTTVIHDWGDKAVTGQHFYRADREGDWSAIDYAGEKAWFYDPHGENTTLTQGMVVTPKEGKDTIPVYGAAYPEDAAYKGTGIDEADRGDIQPLQYEISEGQKYVADGPFQSDYYYSKFYDSLSENQVVKGQDAYYQISLNHRLAFVKKDDVHIVASSVEDIKAVVANFDKMKDFENDQTVHDLEIHLEAVGHFEKNEKPQKVIKHLKGFKTLLKYKKNSQMMSEDTYETLKTVTDSLLDRTEGE